MKILLILSTLLLTSCAGITTYEITTPDGVYVKVHNSKNYDSYTLIANKTPDGGYTVSLQEIGVSASDPMKETSKIIDKLVTLIPKTP